MEKLRACSSARLRLDRLETRDCPAMPAFTGCALQYLPNREAIVSGYLADESPDTATVTFAGVVDAAMITPDKEGYFEARLTVNELGEIQMTAADDEGNETPCRSIVYSNIAPRLRDVTLRWDSVEWILEGWLEDEAPFGLDVEVSWSTFTGWPFEVLPVDSDGHFSIGFGADPPGEHSAEMMLSVSDWWGMTHDALITA